MNCMPAKPVNPLDMATWKYVYIKYAVALDHMIPWINEQINNSDTKFVAIPFEDLIKEMGITCDEKCFSSLYAHLKFIMFTNGIVINSGTHSSGKRVFTMRMASYKDKMPKYWKKRARSLKKLMKSNVWRKMVDLKKGKGELR